MATTKALKFYRKAQAPSSPAAGAIWFNTTDKTIQIYTGSEWEKYAGNLKDATWSGNTLTITKYDGSSIALDFSDMASKSAMEAQIKTINENITKAQNAADAAQADVDLVEKALGTGFSEASTVAAQLAAVKTTADAAATKQYVDDELAKKADKTQVATDIAAAQSAAETNAANDAASKVAAAKTELIGNSSDTKETSTIYGAKAYADSVGTANLTDAKSYTDSKIQTLDVEDTAVSNQYVSSVSETDGKITVSRVALPVTGVKSADKVLQLTNGEVSSTITISYNKTDKKIYLYGIDQTTPISEIDATDFIADSFLDDVELDASDNLQFTWKMADGSTKTDTVNISKYIDTYKAGTGLSLSDKTFSVDTTEIATVSRVNSLRTTVSENHTELVSLAGATVNTKAIGTVDADGKVSGNAITLAGSDIAITGYTKGTASDLAATDTINQALGKLEARVDAAAAGGVQSVNGHSGNVTIATGSQKGTILISSGAGVSQGVQVAGLKTAAYTDSSDYATAEQGATADSAVQTVTTDNTNQLDVARTGNDVEVNVKLATKSDMMSGHYRNEATGNGNESPLITASTVDYFVTNYVSSAINTALVWEEFE